MNIYVFLIASLAYFVIFTLISLSLYFGLKKLEKSNNKTVSSTAKLYAYRKITGIWQGSLIFWLMISFLIFHGRINSNFFVPGTLLFLILFFWYYLTRFRKKTIELTDEIKKTNPKLGEAVQFSSGFSKNTGSEMLKLFAILIIGIGLIFALVFVLTKYKLI